MIYQVEESLRYFKFWGQAESNARDFTESQLDQLDDIIGDLFGEVPTDTAINDLFAYNVDYLKELLGFKKLSNGEYINPDDVPSWDDEANAENLEIILSIAGVDLDTRRKLGRIADDINTAQRNNAEVEDYHPFNIEDFICALEAVQSDGDADDVRNTALFYMSDQAVRILLHTYVLMLESDFDIDEVKNVIYE